MKIVVTSLIGLFLTACVTNPSGNISEDIDGLAQFSENWAGAYAEGNFDKMRDLYEPDAWLMTRHQTARKGVDEILAYFAASRAKGGKADIQFEDEDETIDGDYAFKVAKWWLEVPTAIGEPVRDSGRSLVIFKKGSDGIWRLWRDIDNHTPDVTFDNQSLTEK